MSIELCKRKINHLNESQGLKLTRPFSEGPKKVIRKSLILADVIKQWIGQSHTISEKTYWQENYALDDMWKYRAKMLMYSMSNRKTHDYVENVCQMQTQIDIKKPMPT